MKKQQHTTTQQEVDHRIKNSLNIVSSMLGLQISSLKNGAIYNTVDILKKSKLRIDTLAIVHDLSYRNDTMQKVNFISYLKELIMLINTTYASDIEVEILADDIDIELDTILCLGIILNELLMNSLKQTFSRKENIKMVVIKLQKQPNYCLLTYLEKRNTLVDIPQIKQSKALGLKLLMLTIKQMRAHFNISQNGGLVYTIRFECM